MYWAGWSSGGAGSRPSRSRPVVAGSASPRRSRLPSRSPTRSRRPAP